MRVKTTLEFRQLVQRRLLRGNISCDVSNITTSMEKEMRAVRAREVVNVRSCLTDHAPDLKHEWLTRSIMRLSIIGMKHSFGGIQTQSD